MILAAFRAEWFKAVRRPAIWITIGLLLVLAVGVFYVVIYLVATHTTGRVRLQGANLASLRSGLYPGGLVKKALGQANGLDGIFALILGVLLQGSEYGWQTVKTSSIQLPGRLAVLTGRLGSLALLVLFMVLALFAVDALASYVIALVDGKSTAFPTPADILRAMAAAWLIMGFWAAFGVALATLFRQSAMAIGLGLAYGLVIETLVFGLLGGLGDVVTQVHVWFPIANGTYLLQAFGADSGNGGGAAAVVPTTPEADATHAVLVLLAYVAGLVILSGVLTRRRDVL
ncbi:MAG TPA: ABC transporter permease subunit [Candidatus Acidoferrum sp.]|nr:ABC transporter permease subunit [Candidatus Acidoferrum sp.]